MKIGEIGSTRRPSSRSWLDYLNSSRGAGFAIVMVFAVIAIMMIDFGGSAGNNKKKGEFKNANGEVVPAQYFKNKKGQTAKAARVRNPWARVDRISILGERNSGTRWMTKELRKCFPQVEVKSELQRWKHWFQEDDGQEHLTTLVVAQFRDPYYWAEAMRHVPHHAPNHQHMSGDSKKEWMDFMTKDWTLGKRPKRDLELKNKDEHGICYENFNYNELESCIEGSETDPEYLAMFDKNTGLNEFGYPKDDPHDFKAAKPMYELRRDGSGKPYDNLMEMRAAKIRNFLEIKKWNWVKDLAVVRYEEMLAKGTESLIAQIEKITTHDGVTQLERNCTPAAPQVRSKRVIDPDLVDWITANIDWKAENKIGYKKWHKQTKEDMKAYKKSLELASKD
jgi:hypothetical protein